MAPRVYACLYIRKSNEDQEKKSLSAQIDEGRKYCKRQGWTVREEHIFCDEASAYSAKKRKAFIEMVDLACAKNPLFTKVVVWKIDRFTRRVQDGFKYWQMLHDNDVEVISMTQTFGGGAGGRMNLGMHFMMAQFYSDNLSEDVERGLRSAALKGWWTSHKVPFGYQRCAVDGRYKLKINNENAAIVRQIFDHAIKGWGSKRIAEQYNFTKQYVDNILKNEHVTGDRIIHGKSKKELLRVEDAHPAIIDKQTFGKAQRIIRSRSRVAKAEGVGHSLYANILKCACGRLMHRNDKSKKGSDWVYYQCNGKRDGSGCTAGNVKEDRVTELVLDLIAEKVFSPDAIKQMVQLAEKKRQNGDLQKATKHLHREKAENKAKQRRLVEMVRDDIITMGEIKDDMEQLKADADDIEAKLHFAPEEPIKLTAMKTLLKRLERDLTTFTRDNEKRHDAMRELVKEIVVDLPLIRITTSLMAVEDEYQLYYFTPPTVPKDYQRLWLHQKRALVSKIKKFIGDNRRNNTCFHDNRIATAPIIQWRAAELDAYIEQYTSSVNAGCTLKKTA